MYRGLFLLLIVPLFTVTLYAVEKVSDIDIKSAYIYQLSKRIYWPKESLSGNFYIHIVEDERALSRKLKSITKNAKLKSHKIIVTRSTTQNIPDNVNVIFIQKNKSDLLTKTFDKFEGKNVLIISEGFENKRQIMINLFENDKKQIRFEINKANIVNQGLAVDPNIILLGGTEIDVAKLYKQSQQSLRTKEKHLLKLESLNARLEKETQNAKEMNLTLNKKIDSQKTKLQETTDQLKAKLDTIKKQEQTLKKQLNKIAEYQKEMKIYEKDILKQKDELKEYRLKIDEYEQKIQKQQNDIKKIRLEYEHLIKVSKEQEINIQKRTQELDKQSLEIKKRTKILDEQLGKIEELDAIINKQQETITSQSKKIEVQTYTMALLGVILLLSFILGITVYNSRRKLKLLNDELAEQTKKADYANSSKSVFLANMSHELRTPLNAILGFSELLSKERNFSTKQKDTLSIINRSGNHLLNLINDVLSISKIEAGKIPIEIEAMDIGTITHEIVDTMQVRASKKGLTIELDQTSSFPRFIKSDPSKIRQIILNFVSNAIKYTNEGLITLKLDTKDNHLDIKVTDTGVGISKAELPFVFDPFIQVGSASAKTGTGLGLTITKEYAKLLGGSVGVESEPGKGSCFWADIPYEESSAVETSSVLKENRDNEILGLCEEDKDKKILIVEDKLDNRLLLRSVLEVLGVQIKEAVNGEEAVEIFKQWQPDFIWMDRRMPVMDGEEATKIIRTLPGGKDVIISALTASAFDEEKEIIMSSGMDDFVTKPFKSHEVYECMGKHLNLKYIYKEQPEDKNNNTDIYNNDEIKQMLENFNEEILNELKNNILLGDNEEIYIIIKEIEKENKKLSKILKELTDNYQMHRVLNILKSEGD